MLFYKSRGRNRVCGKLVFVFLTAFFVLIAKTTSAQFLGTTSNYSGSRALAVNPSLMTTSYNYSDFGLNLNFGAYNDMFFAPSKEIISVIKGNPYGYKYEYNGNLFDIGFLANTKSKYLTESLDVNALSFMINPNGKQAFGFFMNTRLYSGVNKIPWEIPEMMIVSLDNGDYFNQNYQSRDWDVSTMTWGEIGFSYSRIVYERYDDKIDVGASLKGLVGFDAAVLRVNNLDYEMLNRDSAYIHSIDFDALYSLPVNYDANFNGDNILNTNKIVSGYGLGFDIGVTYTRKKDTDIPKKVKVSCAYPITPYKWRVGLSILDIGAIKFNNNAVNNKFASSKDVIIDFSTFNNINTFGKLVDTLSVIFDDDKTQSSAEAITIGLPTALSLQFDYNFGNNLYVNVLWVHPLRLMTHSVCRAASVVLEPRYETTFFEVSLPVTLYNYEKIFIGLSVRAAFVTVGTQNLLNLVGIGDAYGADFYVSLKFNFAKGRCHGYRGACWNADFR